MSTKPKLGSELIIEKLLRREKALGEFGTFAFRETALQAILNEAARVCSECLDVSFSKICRYDAEKNDLRVVAGHGWKRGVVGYAISVADETSPQGRAFTTGEPQLCSNIEEANIYKLPSFYPEHHILSTVDVLVAAKSGRPFGVLEVDSPDINAFSEHDINFLTGFANVLAEAVATSERVDALRQTVVHMAQLVEDKETMSLELQHRVRNSLHLVYGLLTAEVSDEHDGRSIEAFRAIAARVMGLAHIFDHLLGVGMSKLIDFSEYVVALCHNLPDLYQDMNVALKCDVLPVYLELDKATTLGVIITELVSNAYLHAFPDGSGGILVTLRLTSDRVVLTVSDNGIGFKETETTRRGIGLVKRLVKQLDGGLSHESDSGSKWTVVVAMAEGSPMATAA